ncbi:MULTISPECIES: tetratricopeptide repeat-containing sensor histidine kinase [unclassified Croceitalea]|uniref:tetratricopeptide repeat-containing sensor histidine kinase n=1 Tax=unclassified Croceitalea TaxID=2632280 RepID=UPI0030DCA2B3
MKNQQGFHSTDIKYLNLLGPLAESYVYQNKDSLLKYTQELKELSIKAEYKKGILNSDLIRARYEAFNGNPKKGAEDAHNLFNKAKNLGLDSLAIEALNIEAVGWSSTGDFPKGYVAFKKAESIAERINHQTKLFTIRMNLGTSFSLLKDYDKALEYYIKNLESLKNKNQQFIQKAQLEANMSFLYWKNGNYSKSKFHNLNATKVFASQKNAAWESFCRITLGGVAIKEMDIKEAIYQYSLAKNLLKNMNDKKRETDANLGFAEAYLSNKNLKLSEEFLHKAIEIATEIEYKDGLSLGHNLLYQLYLSKGEFEKAIKNLEISHNISNSLRVQENKTQFLMLVAQTEYEREQEKLKIESDKKLTQQKAINRIAIFVLIISLIIGTLIRQNYINQKKANKKLKEINTTKDKIFSIIGHDLKTPLSTLNELLGLFEKKVISPKEMGELTPRIQKNVDYTTFTLNNLLFWAQSQMNSIMAHPTEVDVKKIIDETISVFETEAHKKCIEITNSVTQKCMVRFDCEHLRIIFRNLINNAIKFTPENGKVTIGTKTSDEEVTITICDTGIGFDKKLLSEHFTSSVMFTTKGTNNEKGTGLGLSICKELAQKNNSQIMVEQNKPDGSCLLLKIPT